MQADLKALDKQIAQLTKTTRAFAGAKNLQAVPGMTSDLMRRHAQGMLEAIEAGLRAPGQRAPQVDREPEEVRVPVLL